MKEQVVNFLKKIHLSHIAFAIFTIRLVVFGASIGDSLALTSIVALIGFESHLKHKAGPDINKTVLKEIKLMKDKVSALSMNKTIGQVKDGQNRRLF